MSSEYFTEKVEPTCILTTQQALTLYRYFARNRTGDTAGFETKERTPMLNVGRFKTLGLAGGFKRNKMDAIVFQCSRDILLKGIQVYGTDQGPGQLAINVRLIQEAHRANLATKNIILETDGKRKVYTIVFDETRCITKEIKYSIEIIVNGPTTFYGVDEEASVECDAVQITFSKSDKGTNPTDVERGQVPGMVFEVTSDYWSVKFIF
ncbi:E3 ubiquitin-protein ligase rpm-1-like [Dreissena polymorpha]|uniref:E3 ubiquitin-protein ligase rpm-1-like n=1 Tax=Dreissena polymorpha TaxID=45954 RepID=UPI00226549B0|nr:E3 ubiquitin-protein ligase rpm-1-like [Dreissena polymorpha]